LNAKLPKFRKDFDKAAVYQLLMLEKWGDNAFTPAHITLDLKGNHYFAFLERFFL